MRSFSRPNVFLGIWRLALRVGFAQSAMRITRAEARPAFFIDHHHCRVVPKAVSICKAEWRTRWPTAKDSLATVSGWFNAEGRRHINRRKRPPPLGIENRFLSVLPIKYANEQKIKRDHLRTKTPRSCLVPNRPPMAGLRAIVRRASFAKESDPSTWAWRWQFHFGTCVTPAKGFTAMVFAWEPPFVVGQGNFTTLARLDPKTVMALS